MPRWSRPAIRGRGVFRQDPGSVPACHKSPQSYSPTYPQADGSRWMRDPWRGWGALISEGFSDGSDGGGWFADTS
jgi:hypothetical protein